MCESACTAYWCRRRRWATSVMLNGILAVWNVVISHSPLRWKPACAVGEHRDRALVVDAAPGISFFSTVSDLHEVEDLLGLGVVEHDLRAVVGEHLAAELRVQRLEEPPRGRGVGVDAVRGAVLAGDLLDLASGRR